MASVVPAFILCTPRSGSTLLRWLLDSHPTICVPAEISLGLLCEQLVIAFNLTLGQVQEGRDSDEAVHYFSEVRRIMDSIMDPYCIAKNKTMWCDKTPTNVNHLSFLNAVFPDARYICLYRHGLDTVRSELEMRMPALFGSTAVMQDKSGEHVTSYMNAWCQRTETLLAFESGDRCVLRIRYEDLVTEPIKELKKLCDFLQVECYESMIADAFANAHDDGPGDYKICGSTGIYTASIGRGLSLPLDGVPAQTRQHVLTLLGALDY